MTLLGALGAAFLAGSILTGGAVAVAAGKDACNAPDGCAGLVHEGFTYPFPREAGSYLFIDGALTIDGETLAVGAVPALQRKFRPIDSSQALAAILPRLAWKGSVLDLLYANVSDPQGRAERSDRLKPLGVLAEDPHAKGMEACAGSRTGPEKPF